MTDEAMNGNLTIRAVVHTEAMQWTASPSGTVWRKRMHLVGPAEAGQVTSIVRYEPGATFPAHDHPGGEEILVLDGVFSDEHGDWPVGTYLLNPEGFRHAPFSQPGCTLLVKLRQYPGRDREHHAIDTGALDWEAGAAAGISIKNLYCQTGYTDIVCLERWGAGTAFGSVEYEQGVEYFVLDGDFEDEAGRYPIGSWLRMPAGASHAPRSNGGCELYVKRGGLRYLQDGAL